MRDVIVIALGGNAILQPKQKGEYETQLENVQKSCEILAKLIAQGENLVISHGNGPQVGNLLLQNEEAKNVVPPMPLDVLSAQTQGMIGYMIEQCLDNELKKLDIKKELATFLTRVEVDPKDPAFMTKTKPVGPFYTKEESDKLIAEKAYDMMEDSGRGYRRVVASPIPQKILEAETIKTAIDSGSIVVAGGGGGIPVVKQTNGQYIGYEAVIDKDLCSCKLAKEILADKYVILTDVENVYIKYGKPDQKALFNVSAQEMQQYIDQGEFGKGSMEPKIVAALDFVNSTGKTAYICSLNKADEVLAGNGGTVISK